MTLSERLDTIRQGAKERIPEDIRASIKKAQDELSQSIILKKICKAGDALPSFALARSDGRIVESEDLHARGPLVLTFYRGVW